MPRRRIARPVATLWQLSWKDDRLLCAVYRAGSGLEMRLESGATVLLTEPFELAPKMLSRTNALKRSLKRRGWQEPRGQTDGR